MIGCSIRNTASLVESSVAVVAALAAVVRFRLFLLANSLWAFALARAAALGLVGVRNEANAVATTQPNQSPNQQ